MLSMVINTGRHPPKSIKSDVGAKMDECGDPGQNQLRSNENFFSSLWDEILAMDPCFRKDDALEWDGG